MKNKDARARRSLCKTHDINLKWNFCKIVTLCLCFLPTWSSLSNPGALQYPPSPAAQGDRGSAPPLASSHWDKTLPSSPCSATHGPAVGEKGSEAEADTDPGTMPSLLGLEEASCAESGSGGRGGGGELGVGNEGSSGTKGSGGGLRNPRNDVLPHYITSNSTIDERCARTAYTYFQREQRHRMVLWDSCHTAACHYTLWIYRSVNG